MEAKHIGIILVGVVLGAALFGAVINQLVLSDGVDYSERNSFTNSTSSTYQVSNIPILADSTKVYRANDSTDFTGVFNVSESTGVITPRFQDPGNWSGSVAFDVNYRQQGASGAANTIIATLVVMMVGLGIMVLVGRQTGLM